MSFIFSYILLNFSKDTFDVSVYKLLYYLISFWIGKVGRISLSNIFFYPDLGTYEIMLTVLKTLSAKEFDVNCCLEY